MGWLVVNKAWWSETNARGVAVAAAANSKDRMPNKCGSSFMEGSDAVTKGRWGRRVVIDCQEIIRNPKACRPACQ